MSRNIWFDYLGTAHVQTGTYQVAETYLPGKHHLQGVTQITPPGATPQPYPESFSADWAWNRTPTDAVDKGYDPGAYGVGAPVHTRTIDIPLVKEVHLLYYYDMESTREERNLVQVDVADGDPVDDLGDSGLGIVHDNLSRKVFTENQFYEAFAPQGYNQFGFVLPRGMSRSKVHELHSFTGTFEDIDENSDVYTVYFEPVFINNDLPLFSFIYMQKDVTDLRGNVPNISSHILRWQGGIPSSTIAPINREGSAIVSDGYLYNVGAQVVTTPNENTTVVIDGVTYGGADQYNIGYKRR